MMCPPQVRLKCAAISLYMILYPGNAILCSRIKSCQMNSQKVHRNRRKWAHPLWDWFYDDSPKIETHSIAYILRVSQHVEIDFEAKFDRYCWCWYHSLSFFHVRQDSETVGGRILRFEAIAAFSFVSFAFDTNLFNINNFKLSFLICKSFYIFYVMFFYIVMFLKNFSLIFFNFY